MSSTRPRQLGEEPQWFDAELHQKVSEALDARNKAAREALDLLERAEKALSRARSFDDGNFFSRASNNVYRAITDTKNGSTKPTEAYIRNMAVGVMGNRILAMDDDLFETIVQRVRGDG